MPRLVRRRPLSERLKAYLNPLDFLLWLSEEFETRDWDTKTLAASVGIALNIIFIIARSNAGRLGHDYADDVFGDSGGISWFGWLCAFLVPTITLLSVSNAVYTFLRKRRYRLFETSIDSTPGTPSATRVKVDSTPATASPLRLLTSILGDSSAESRSHPDPTRDVWEIAIWDPLPICLDLFCFFSPGHILVYWLFLPIPPTDPRPSTTVATSIFLAALLSFQLFLFKTYFELQSRDNALIHKEVLHEYDVKFVHPLLNRPVRDVGTQVSFDDSDEVEDDSVEIYSPTTVIHRTFEINPNPNYAKHVDVNKTGFAPRRVSSSPRPSSSPEPMFKTPIPSRYAPRESSPLRPPGIWQPHFRQSASAVPPRSNAAGVSTGINASDGGSLGIYTHPNSPLKKASSLYELNKLNSPRNSREMARREMLEERIRERSKSPVKAGYRHSNYG